MTGSEPVSSRPSPGADPEVRRITLDVCDLCLSGAGGECHTPDCAFWLNRAPDLPLTPTVEAEGIVRVDTRDEATASLMARAITAAWRSHSPLTMARAVLAALRGEQP